MEHLTLVLQRLKEEQLYTKFNKCNFWLTQIGFLGHVVSGDGISVDSNKTKVVMDWLRSTTVTEICNFLGKERSLNGITRVNVLSKN